ncbi:hypothetical protein D3C73_1343570 [compost metagenome]
MIGFVEVFHQVAVALVDIDGTRVGLIVGLRRVHGSQKGAGLGVDDAHRSTSVRPEVHHPGSTLRVGPEPPSRPLSEVSLDHQAVQKALSCRPEEIEFRRSDRQLGGRRA